MGKFAKTLAGLLVSLVLVSFMGVPALAAGEVVEPVLPGRSLADYNAADITAINTMIQNNAGLNARYQINEPWNWDFAAFRGDAVAGMCVEEINLRDQITGIVGGSIVLADMPELKTIVFADVQITEIKLSGLPKVTHFLARGNKIKDLDLSGMPNLTHVQVGINYYNKSWSAKCNTFESISIKGCKKLESFDINHENHSYLNTITNKFIQPDGATINFKHPAKGKIQMYYQWLAGAKPDSRFQLYYPCSDFKAWKFTPSSVKTEHRYTSEQCHIILYAQKTKNITVAVTTQGGTSTAPAAKVSKVNFPQAKLSLTMNKSITIPALAYTSTSKKAKLSYTSSNPGVATVDAKGKIVAVAPGTTTITAKAGGKKDTLKVTVLPTGAKAAKVSKVSGNVPAAMNIGTTKYITAKYTPAKAANVRVTYTSSNSSVVAVDKTGRLVAKQAGTATITIKAGGKSRKYQVTVP